MSKAIKTIAIILLLGVVLTLSFGAGCNLATKTEPSLDQDLDTVVEAWNIILQDYVDKDNIDTAAMSQAAIEGMLEALDDPHSSYLDPENYKLSLTSLEGKLEGIGAQVAMKEGQLMIIAPIPDSPAARAGIRAGDIVLEVNGRPTSEMSLAEAVLTVRGPAGTPVRLLILHQDETEPEEIEIVRAEIDLPSVHFEMRQDIAYISLTYFSERTDEELSPVLQSIADQAATGIILDLRSNSGGLLQTVVDVASHFLREGIIVSMVDNQGKHTTLSVTSKEVITDLPLVVLVDSYSASGSEVLAGALQDYARATIAGTRTFGKGSVNTLHQLKDGSGLYLTIARWLTPNGRLIEGEGLYPDYELDLIGEEAIQWAIDYLTKAGD